MTLVRGSPVLDAARIGAARDRGRARRSQPGQAARRRGRRRRAGARARRGGPRARARAGAAPRNPARTLVAMSGGVDSAVAALLCAREGETVAVTLELWSDRENDAERSCCSASAVAQARVARALDGPRPLHDRSAGRVPRRRGRAVHRLVRRGRDAEPVRRLQRARAARRDAGARRPARLRASGHRSLRAGGRVSGPCRPAAARRGGCRQGPDLHARRARRRRRWRGCGSRSGS